MSFGPSPRRRSLRFAGFAVVVAGDGENYAMLQAPDPGSGATLADPQPGETWRVLLAPERPGTLVSQAVTSRSLVTVASGLTGAVRPLLRRLRKRARE